MFSSIIVPLDGSRFSEHALPLAQQIATSTGAALRLVRVHLPLISTDLASYRMAAVPVFDATLDQQSRAAELAYLQLISRRVTNQQPLTVTTTLLDGPVAEAISAYGATLDQALIVMTTHGHGALTRFWLGSVADSLVRHSPVPVLLQRPQDDVLPAPAQLRRILVPLDGSELAEQILDQLLALGDPAATHYTLLHVLDPLVLVGATPLVYGATPDSEAEQLRADKAHAYLERIAGRLREQGAAVTTEVLTAPAAAPAILQLAQEQHAELIALATHGRSGLARLLLGSVADKVLRAAMVPVLIHRPQPQPAAPLPEEHELTAVI